MSNKISLFWEDVMVSSVFLIWIICVTYFGLSFE